MSISESTVASPTDTVAALEALLVSGAPVSEAELGDVLRAAVRLYVARSHDPYGDGALRALTVTPTEACIVATALLHSQSLSPFEFSVWFSTSGR